jgi:AcrR family transcriptional regulator
MNGKAGLAPRRSTAKPTGRAATTGRAGQAGTPAQERELRAQGQKTMRRLLEAGQWVFERRGFHAARVDDVVKRAKTSHGTFYLYFSNKEDLFRALAVDAMEEMAALAETIPDLSSSADPRQDLLVWVTSFFDTYAEHGTVIKSWTEGEIVDTDLGVTGTRLLRTIGGALSKHIPEQPGVDSDVAGMAFLAMLERINYLAQSKQIRFEREAMLQTVTSVAMAGFFPTKT